MNRRDKGVCGGTSAKAVAGEQAGALVADPHQGLAARLLQGQPGAAAVLDGVVHQVGEHPLQGQGVDMVWNPWLTDEPVREWLRSLLVEVSAGLAPRPPAGGAGRPARR